MRTATTTARLTSAAALVVITACSPGAVIDAPAPAPTTVPPTVPTASVPIVPVPSSVYEVPGQPPVVLPGTVARPDPGVAYEYHLYVHCGIRAANFGDREWVVASTTSVPRGSGDGGDRQPDINYRRGSMTLVAPDRARFAWDGGTADFVPATTPPPPCA